jgi:hypothetical protein
MNLALLTEIVKYALEKISELSFRASVLLTECKCCEYIIEILGNGGKVSI